MKEEQNKNESGNKKVVLTAVIFFLIGFGAAWIYTKPVEAPTNEKNTEDVIENKIPSMGENALEVNDQKNGSTVVIQSVTLERAGWVAIHDDVDGNPGNILGAAWFPNGKNAGVVELLRATESGKTYFAMLHNDDGDKAFDHKIDVPLTDASSTILMVKFMTTETPAIQ